MRHVRHGITLLSLLTAAVTTAPPAAAAQAPPVRATGDFNGDGYADLAVGSPGERIGNLAGAGVLHVIYGGSRGLTARGSQLWHQDVPGVLGTAEWYDLFGHAVAGGDFNGDGFDDLAVGVPSETIGTEKKQGVVQVLYGSRSGLTATGNEMWRQGADGVPGTGSEWERFGAALAAGDFDDDGRDDLAVGAPYDMQPGTVTVLHGVPGGLHPGPSFTGPEGAGAADFGMALAAGDLDGSGVDDLAVGAPGASRVTLTGQTVTRAGLVTVLFGTAGTGLTTTGSLTIDQDSPGVGDEPEQNDDFGSAVAAGDVDADGDAELAVSAPNESGPAAVAGVVHVLNGTTNGPAGAGGHTFQQGADGVPGTPYRYDMFGLTLTFGDFDGNTHADLVIGSPFDNEADNLNDSGSVVVLRGDDGGLSTERAEMWHQDVIGVPDPAEAGEWFGFAATRGDYDGDGDDDLAIGTPHEGFSGRWRAGTVTVLRGSSTGLSTSGAQRWHQDVAGVPGAVEQGDAFGLTLDGSRRGRIYHPLY